MNGPIKAFRFDERNIGGLVQIELHMQNHLSSLSKVQPMIRFPSSHMQVATKKIYKTNPKASFTRKQTNFVTTEHIRNLCNLQKKLNCIHRRSMSERKKNPYDPIAHPSLFFRRKDELASFSVEPNKVNKVGPIKAGIYGKELNNLKRKNRSRTACNSTKNSTETDIQFSELIKGGFPLIRPQSTAHIRQREIVEKMYDKYFDKNQNKVRERLGVEKKDPYAKLKRILIGKIVNFRIYKEEDLKLLFEQTVCENKEKDLAKIRQVWNEIMSELNS